MILFWFDLVVLILGFYAAGLLFWRIPRLPREKAGAALRVSVIIPARNEEATLPLLLSDLMAQSFPPHEIIVVDDDSQDSTAQIARAFPVRLLSITEKPAGWVGKNWACQVGADAASGDSLLFLDADVRLEPDGLGRIASAHQSHGALSVQPYHATHRWYEQFSLFFNLVQVAANGSALPKQANLGLYGPVIALSREDYEALGGHASVKCAVVEDLALAQRLRDEKIPFRDFVGDSGVSFRMYPGGIAQLYQGFTKNLATVACKIPLGLFLLVTLFISSVTSAPLHLILSLAAGSSLALLYGSFYALWAVLLLFISKRLGRFWSLGVLFYPLSLLMFFLVFLNSFTIRVLHRKVKWKGRAIELER